MTEAKFAVGQLVRALGLPGTVTKVKDQKHNGWIYEVRLDATSRLGTYLESQVTARGAGQ